MARVERVTAQAVFDLFTSLDENAQAAFVKYLASRLTGNALFVMLGQMEITEQKQFTDKINEALIPPLLTLFARHAIQIVSDSPEVSRPQMEEELITKVTDFMRTYDEELGQVEQAKLKQQRDRKSSPETARRNVEICDLRKQDAKKWSLTKLARKYDVSKRYVSKVLNEEDKWRQLAR